MDPKRFTEISDCILELEMTGETATAFVHYTTDRLYPLVKSVLNSSWSEQDAVDVTGGIFPQNVSNVIADIVCLHDILHALPPSETA